MSRPLLVSTPRFALYLKEVRANKEHPHLDQLGWLVSSFRFGDEYAEFCPSPEHYRLPALTLAPHEVSALWRELARNPLFSGKR